MSTAPSAHDAGPDAAPADPHDHFDGEPIQVLAADEPRTPTWLPILGLSLFVVAAVSFLASRPSSPQPAKAVVAEVAPAPPEPVAAPGNGKPGVAGLRPIPNPNAPTTAGAEGALQRLTPEQIRDLQKRIQDMKARQGQPGQGAPPAPAN